jgi:peptidoglycan hydrolase-like protein with peptidoglycan-binding domain
MKLKEITNTNVVINQSALVKDSELIAEIQTCLVSLGYLLSDQDVDGIWGPRTEAALNHFCNAASLNNMSTGQFGKTFAEKLLQTKSLLNPQLDQITQVAIKSAIATYPWKNRGVAPKGYIKGMALVYAKNYCKLKAGDATATEMAKAKTGNSDKDALAWLDDLFHQAGMSNDTAGVDTLRHLFVLLIGLGMRESSGRCCEGRDRSAENSTAETAEAGLFQTSFNARHASPLLPKLFQQYLAKPSGFLEIFQEGVQVRSGDLDHYGEGDGKTFQCLSKECPAFAVEFAAVGLRNIRRHWGPINRKEVELLSECDAMLMQVQKVVDESNLCPAFQ